MPASKYGLAVFISGRGSNMLSIAESCKSGLLSTLSEIRCIFSDNPSAIGIEKAGKLGFPVLSAIPGGRSRQDFEIETIRLIEPFKPDYIVLAGFKRILSPYLIGKFKGRIINIHPADSSKFQGLNGYKWAFENKLQKTFITIHFVDEGVDTGSVIAKREVDLTGVTTLEEVEKRGLKVEHEFYPEVLANFFSSKLFSGI
ncbi:MAG: phosphoribosylglycinamide formyltransferase [Candidatus Riflebacteria bacterium]|nr:phosphoribosylglycinamide formyltransferase [Candidatus Riflebacteria bacterium]